MLTHIPPDYKVASELILHTLSFHIFIFKGQLFIHLVLELEKHHQGLQL